MLKTQKNEICERQNDFMFNIGLIGLKVFSNSFYEWKLSKFVKFVTKVKKEMHPLPILLSSCSHWG